MELTLAGSRATAEATHRWLAEVKSLGMALPKVQVREWKDKSSLDLGFAHESGLAVLMFAGRLVTKGFVQLSEASPCCLEGVTYNNNWYGCFACSQKVLPPAPHETHLGYSIPVTGLAWGEAQELFAMLEMRLQTFGVEPLRAQLEAQGLQEAIQQAVATLF